MKHRRWLLLLVPLALVFAWAYQAASWRPKLVGAQPIFVGNGLKQIAWGPGVRLLISPDGKRLVSSGSDNKFTFVMSWNLASRRREWRAKESSNSGLSALAFSPDGRTLAVSADEGAFGRPNFAIQFIETATGKRRPFMKISWQTRLQDAAFLSDRELVVVTSEAVSIVDTRTGKPIRRWKIKLPAPPNQQLFAPGEIRISADGSTVLALSQRTSNTAVATYDGATGKQRGKWFYPGLLHNPRLAPNGKSWAMESGKIDMVQAGQPKTGTLVDVYDCQTGTKLWGPFAVNDVGKAWTWSADGKRIATVFADFQNLDARTGRELGQLAVSGNVQYLALDPRGDWFYTLDDTGKIWRWRAR